MKCFNSGCGWEGDFKESSSHAQYCVHQPHFRFCDCFACEGHHEGKAEARKQAERARRAHEQLCMDIATSPFPVDKCWRQGIDGLAGRLMEGVRR